MKKDIFYIRKYHYIKSEAELDLSSIAPLQRRRLSLADKIAFTVMDKVFDENIEEIVFASRYGEFARLKTIIEQYSEIGEVSPAQFSGSVHNYLAGFFTLEKKSNIPYYATASAENTLSAGLIKSVLSSSNNILFCYADEYGVACIISKDAGGIKCAMTSGGNDNADEAGSFIEFLEGKTPVFESPLCRIERAE